MKKSFQVNLDDEILYYENSRTEGIKLPEPMLPRDLQLSIAKKIVSTVYGFFDSEMPKKRMREKEEVLKRYLCWYFMKEKTSYSPRRMSEFIIGNYDRTTVIHGINVIRNEYDLYNKMKELIKNIDEKI